MTKTLTLYHCDVHEKKLNLWQLIEFITEEFPGVPFKEITATLGISITLEAEMPEPEEIALSS